MYRTMNYSSYTSTRRMVGILLLAVYLLMPLQGLAQAVPTGQNRRLAPGDVIQASIPDRPELNTTLTLDMAGKVPIPEVGDVALGGLTISEAELVLLQKLRLFDPSLISVNLFLQSNTVGGMQFYLIGQVSQPGEYSFAKVPSIWELIRSAGGPTDTCNLRKVRLVREDGSKTEVTELDISGLFEGGTGPDVELEPGDTLVLPALPLGVSGVSTDDGVKVFGAVFVPTVVEIKGPTPLLDVLMLAGAPSADSQLKEVAWVHLVGDIPQARNVNVMDYLESGNPVGNPLIYPGDTVRVEYQKDSWFKENLTYVLVSLASFATIWLAWDNIVNDN